MRILPRHNRQPGFTIVELAVVIVVIGILAMITVFSFGAWKEQIATDEVKNDLNGVKAAMENERNFSNGYPLALPDTFTASQNVNVTYHSGDATKYCVDAKSTSVPSVYYFIDTATTGGEPVYGTCQNGPE